MRDSGSIPSGVAQFLRRHIQSVWQLELLLFLRTSTSPLSAHELAARLGTNPDVLEPVLARFVEAGLVRVADRVDALRYAYSAAGKLRDAVDQTAVAYQERHIAVVSCIYSTRSY